MEFFADVLRVDIEAAAAERDGYNWTWRSFYDTTLCDAAAPAGPLSRACGWAVPANGCSAIRRNVLLCQSVFGGK